MSGLLFLTDDNFSLANTSKGDVLGISTRAITLVLFYSTQCPYCEPFIHIFKKMPGTVSGCQFGMINISTNRSVVEKSKNTIMPLTYVPYIVLYNNGQPIMSYDGPPSEQELQNFIMSIVETNHAKQQFVPDRRSEPAEPPSAIPAYTIGIPKNTEKCYFSWDTAYKS